MAGKIQNLDELPSLLTYATARERLAIEAVIRLESLTDAARELGISLTAVHQRVACARNRFRRRQLGGAAPPDGFTPTHVSTDAAGRVRAVRSRAELPEAHHDIEPDGHAVRGVSTLLNAAGEVTQQWVKTDRRRQDEWVAFTAAVRELAAEIPPAPRVPSPGPFDVDLQTVLPWGDPHLGMLAWASETGESWDLKLAEEVTAQVMADLIDRTPRSAIFTLADLGDLFHAEDDKQITPTAGHKLDVDSRAGKIARVALRVFRTTIDLALLRHGRVHVRLLRGNHDPYKTISLGIWLEAVYADNPRVQIEPYDNPYQFARWGDCAFMWHHGDGSKPQQMPGVFSVADEWQGAVHRYVHTGHIHSQNQWEFPGCSVESFRTLAPADYWAHWKGYRSKRTLDAITYHRTHGEVSRVTQGIVKR